MLSSEAPPSTSDSLLSLKCLQDPLVTRRLKLPWLPDEIPKSPRRHTFTHVCFQGSLIEEGRAILSVGSTVPQTAVPA